MRGTPTGKGSKLRLITHYTVHMKGIDQRAMYWVDSIFFNSHVHNSVFIGSNLKGCVYRNLADKGIKRAVASLKLNCHVPSEGQLYRHGDNLGVSLRVSPSVPLIRRKRRSPMQNGTGRNPTAE